MSYFFYSLKWRVTISNIKRERLASEWVPPLFHMTKSSSWKVYGAEGKKLQVQVVLQRTSLLFPYLLAYPTQKANELHDTASYALQGHHQHL